MSDRASTPPRASAWNRFWFAPTPLRRLGAWRILVCALAMYDVVLYRHVILRDAAAISAGEPARSWNPIYLFDVLGLQPIGVDAAHAVYAAALVTLGMAALGALSRPACLVGAVLFVYWTGLAYSFGKPHHDKVALTFALGALPFAPIGARLSVDAWVAAVRRAGRGGGDRADDPAETPDDHPMACFPIRLAQVSIAIGYFFAGASKLVKGGFDWFNGYTLQGIMMGHDNRWSALFSQSVALCRLNSVGLVLTQTAFPVVFLWRRLLWYFLPMATVFHLVTWQTMDTGPYMRLWLCLAAFLPLERVPHRLRAWLRAGGLRRVLALALIALPTALVVYVLSLQITGWILAIVLAPLAAAALLFLTPAARVDVVHDGSCRRCRRAVALLRGADWAGRLTLLDRTDWPAVERRHPGLDRETAGARELCAITAGGRVTAGHDAYAIVAWRLPLLLPIAALLALPPFRTLARRLGARAARRNRHDHDDAGAFRPRRDDASG